MHANLLITGGTGFIGQTYLNKYSAQYKKIFVLSRRNPSSISPSTPNLNYVNSFADISHPIDYIINLAGEPIADKLWTNKRKQVLRDSRIALTNQLIQWLQSQTHKPTAFLSGSAIGYYGDQGESEVIENTSPHPEFSHTLCKDWEQAALKATELNIRTCVIRTGIVIGPNKGFMKKLVPSFRMGIGTYFGDGMHWMSWIHVDDLVKVIHYLLTHDNCNQVYNAVSPSPITYKYFSQTLAKQLNTKILLPFPAPIAKLLFGEMSDILIKGQKVIPERLLSESFEYQYPDIDSAIKASLSV